MKHSQQNPIKNETAEGEIDLTNLTKVRCAIYTRKSSEEGLEQEFNSLDAQRLAAENFIASQVSKGWVLIPDHYDDGGFSGGNIERPALERLLEDIKEKKIDCVVVYKIDRLTRSLFDFQKVISLFDENNVSFVSVTQSFNTSNSMGRLMLNVLLSFAQYEREITGERIRDKVDASKKKGMWMGGGIPLGYDLKDKKLLVNETEAEIVRLLFQTFIKTESVSEVFRELNRRGFSTKVWTSRSGNLRAGRSFNKENVRRILENYVYIGKITHKDQIYDGLHKAIISEDIWQETQNILKKNSDRNKIRIPVSRVSSPPLLKGMINCGLCGSRMMPIYTSKGSKKYRYYICYSKAVGNNDACAVGRVSATEIENLVISRILIVLKKPEFLVHVLSQSSGVIPESIVINSFKEIEKVWDELFPLEQARIINLLVKKITVNHKGLNIKIFKTGLHSLSSELFN